MKPIPAIVERQVEEVVAELIEAYRALRLAEGDEERAIRKASEHRLHVGRLLAAARGRWPERGPRAKGWGELLKRVGIEQPTAWRYMELAGYVEKTFGLNETPDRIPTYAEAGLDAPRDRDVKPDNIPQLALVPDPGPEIEIDRDTWCTPRWLTEAIGRWDLDPCSNKRSTVKARDAFDLEDGARMDGLHPPSVIDDEMRVFVNPPYSNVPPWIAAYGHTRFCFLLKLDTSTRWFADLHARTELILIPRKRVQFEPPPGVPPERAIAQQFPHALFYARAGDATPEIRALCWAWRVERDQPPTKETR